MVIELPLSQGKVALIDDEDASLAEFKWYAYYRGHTWYAARNVRKPDGSHTTVRLHQAVLPGCPQIDHVDKDGLNNRRENLRPATHEQNQRNGRLRTDNQSGFRGVAWVARDRAWSARISVAGRRKSLGYYADPVAAAQAYDAAARRYHGEFAALNFPEDGERAAA